MAPDIVKVLLENGASANDSSYTAIMTAMQHPSKNIELVRVLLEGGADPNVVRALLAHVPTIDVDPLSQLILLNGRRL